MKEILKKTFLIPVLFIVAITIPFSCFGQENAQLLFDRANDALKAGNIEEALATYNKLEEQKTISGPLFLNMGISYIEIDSLGKAKYYLLKASRHEETEDEAKKGLEYVENQFSRQSAALPKMPWEKAVDWLRINMGASLLLGIAIILFNMGVILFVANWFFELPFASWIKKSGIGLAGLGITIILLSFYVDYVENRYSDAVMISMQTNVLEKPVSDASVISQAYEGYSFTVDHHKSRKQQGWNYVRMSNGLYGWIPSSEIMIL
ncbi:MAG: hypothetical protein U5J95_08620 [Balneolaceae bacterium]|nr:hypothetical protein [Balneolaceae bacterium]